MLYRQNALGFCFEFPDSWRIDWYGNYDPANDLHGALQTSEADLPAAGDCKALIFARNLIIEKGADGNDFESHSIWIELYVWKDNPFKLPSRAKKFPYGDLPFKAQLRPYGNGGQHTAGQLDIGNGYVLHMTTMCSTPPAIVEIAHVLATGKRL